MNSHLWIGFLGGLLSFAHCLGMCGGFVLHLSRDRLGRRMVRAILLWHVGRLFMYMFLGAFAGYAGVMIQKLLQYVWLQNALSISAGIAIFLMGLVLLGQLPVRGDAIPAGNNWLGELFGNTFSSSPSLPQALVLGVTTGCLPCPIVLGFLAYAVQTGTVASGMTVMAGMGLGTLMPLLLFGAAGRLIGLHARPWSRIAGGMILIVLGVTTMLRGTSLYHSILGCASPATTSAGAPEVQPCCTKGTDASGQHD